METLKLGYVWEILSSLVWVEDGGYRKQQDEVEEVAVLRLQRILSAKPRSFRFARGQREGFLGVGQQWHDQWPGKRIIYVWSIEQIIQIPSPSHLVFLPFPFA